jgi:hypothetical protein
LTDPAIELGVAQVEIGLVARRDDASGRRRGRCTPSPGTWPPFPANAADFTPLLAAASSGAAQVAGVPVERAADLPSHADALYGAAALGQHHVAGPADRRALDACLTALSVGPSISQNAWSATTAARRAPGAWYSPWMSCLSAG